jgi:hypothetical protein
LEASSRAAHPSTTDRPSLRRQTDTQYAKAPQRYHKGMGFYFLDDLNTWGSADLRAIIGCYLIIVALVFAYFLADDEPESGGPAKTVGNFPLCPFVRRYTEPLTQRFVSGSVR